MKISKLPTSLQVIQCRAACKFLNSRAGKRQSVTLEQVEARGYDVQWKRVTWLGGVGSSHWMPRRGRYRILVSATKSGLRPGTSHQITLAPGIVETRTSKPQRRGFRYGYCIEL